MMKIFFGRQENLGEVANILIGRQTTEATVGEVTPTRRREANYMCGSQPKMSDPDRGTGITGAQVVRRKRRPYIIVVTEGATLPTLALNIC